jgi:hypothetical protein
MPTNHSFFVKSWPAVALLIYPLSVVTCQAADLSATPYRPSVSSPADLSAPQHFELESGWQQTNFADATSNSSAPWLLKYALTDRFGVMLGGEVARSEKDASGEHTVNYGDTTVALKFKFPHDDTSSFGLETTVKLSTATHSLGSSYADYTLNGIYSFDHSEYHADINLNCTLLDAPDMGQSRIGYGWATGLSHPITVNTAWVAEFSGTRQRGTPDTSQFLAALSWSVTPTLVLDAGAAWGLSPAAADQSLFAGLTLLFE